MSRCRRWIPLYVDDWLAGTADLTLEQEAAYLRVCLLIYSRGGPIPDNERWLAGACRVSTRRWRALRQALVDAGKITIEDGLIRQRRVEFELEKAANFARKQRENASKRWRENAEPSAKPLADNDVADANAYAKPMPARAFPQPHSVRTNVLTAAGAAGDAPPSLDDLIFGTQPTGCLGYLIANGTSERSARSLVGRWRKEFGNGAVIDAIAAARRNAPSDPVAWIAAALKRHAKANAVLSDADVLG